MKTRDRILTLLIECQKPLSLSYISRILDTSRENVRQIVDKMQRDGQVITRFVKGRGKPRLVDLVKRLDK